MAGRRVVAPAAGDAPGGLPDRADGAALRREKSWGVEGTTRTLLRHVASLGHVVSVFGFPASLRGTRPAAVEMHAVDLRGAEPVQHVARVVVGEGGDEAYRCACLLAELVGVDLEDG